MDRNSILRLGLVALACGMLIVSQAKAERPPANVPPSLEIEVLDPGADPNGNPAVRLVPQGDGQMAVDIPPAVLVHRYYYSGDRTFQGPMLPGGPSILVVNHPQTGERTYVPAQMMPGAPRVTYTKDSIEYDYGTNAITLHFGWFGKPTIKYRNGVPFQKKIATVLHTEEIHQHTGKMVTKTKAVTRHSTQAVKGALLELGDVAKMAALPVCNTLEMLPFGKILFSGELGQGLEERAAEYDRQKGLYHTKLEKERNEATFRTLR